VKWNSDLLILLTPDEIRLPRIQSVILAKRLKASIHQYFENLLLTIPTPISKRSHSDPASKRSSSIVGKRVCRYVPAVRLEAEKHFAIKQSECFSELK